jgi:hypothetical protein
VFGKKRQVTISPEQAVGLFEWLGKRPMSDFGFTLSQESKTQTLHILAEDSAGPYGYELDIAGNATGFYRGEPRLRRQIHYERPGQSPQP